MPPVESVSLNLVGESRSVGLARRFVSDALCTWGINGLVDSARLVVSELVTNAVLHARSDVSVTLLFDGLKVRLEVSDDSPEPPRKRHYGNDATTGRGLALVDATSSSWGTTLGEGGKTVWAELTFVAGGRPPDRTNRTTASAKDGAARRGPSGGAGSGAGAIGDVGSRYFEPPRGPFGPWRVA